MLKKEVKLLAKFVAVLIIVLLGQMNGSAQTLSETIDISSEFNNIEEYNKHIRLANLHHYSRQKNTAAGVSFLVMGVAGTIGSIVFWSNYNVDDSDDIDLVIGSVTGAMALVGFISAFEDRGGLYSYRAEQDALKEADALFEIIPNKK